uniref:Uncharacterized protein n=1 Tax=Nelumbo nucifera TaxID=4432 RepID=A0A822ZGT2_NELNU|nr:TPA_asm: hypothetical protein HUJ06_001930 [Nelumbo nucifera]
MYWTVEEGTLPVLGSLRIYRCTKLKMLPDGLRQVNTLKELKLTMPTQFSDRLRQGGEDWDKIKHVASITT